MATGRRAGVVAGGFGARVCRAWVRLYTARMDTETAARRREELESDLADHAREAQTARIRPSAASVEMIGRTLSGMPADLSWRWRSGGGRQGGWAVEPRTITRWDAVLTILVAIDIGIVVAMVPILGSGFDADAAGSLLVLFALSALLVVGLGQRDRRPMLSLGLLVFGSLAPSLAWFWLPPVYLLTIATIAVAIITTRRAPRPAL